MKEQILIPEQKLRDWFSTSEVAIIQPEDKVSPLLDCVVVEDYSLSTNDHPRASFIRGALNRKWSHVVCIVKKKLKSGKNKYYAVGLNENPSLGLSFPVKLLNHYPNIYEFDKRKWNCKPFYPSPDFGNLFKR